MTKRNQERTSPKASKLPTIAEKTAGMQKLAGYLNLYWDAKTGKLWLETDNRASEFLYQIGLRTGIGSSNISLDRGSLGWTHLARFERSGPKLLLIARNLKFRADGQDSAESRAARESFAESALWGFTVEAEEQGRLLVDATDFFLHDAFNIPDTLRTVKQGNFRLEASRCAISLAETRNFLRNTEVDALLTFTADDPGPWFWTLTPSPGCFTLSEHHSFAHLPSPGYKPRVYDPRAGFFGITFKDFSVPISEPVTKRFIARHRLKKKNPNAAASEPVKPIVYYLDRGTPEPVRSAILEGANWWNQAFEAAGYKNAFCVRLMPKTFDPMDLRHNVIQWVHRERRGWSYGNCVIDPRTGEIIKGHVVLDSLRIRQDFLIAEALLSPYEKGVQASSKMLDMALARMRQLAAHEVGHSLGLVHNFSASTVKNSSVMDYPPPYVTLGADGVPDLSEAYAIGIGEWDKMCITFGYQHFPEGTDEHAALNKILNDGFARGLRFLTDLDAEPVSSSSSVAHLWDSGANAVDELNRIMEVRSTALRRFGENNIRDGAPMATLEDVFVPLYMLHRYQVEAASKLVGGMDYTFALRGDGQVPTRIVDPREQRRALTAILATLKPAVLALPESLLEIIPPRPPDFQREGEHFKIRTSPVFDALAPAEEAAQHTLHFLFNPERAARLVEFHARDPQNPGLGEVLDQILASTWKSPHGEGCEEQIANIVDNVVLHDLMALAANNQAGNEVRAIAVLKMEELREWLNCAGSTVKDSQKAHFRFAAIQIAQFQKEPQGLVATPPAEPPGGPPLGDCGIPW